MAQDRGVASQVDATSVLASAHEARAQRNWPREVTGPSGLTVAVELDSTQARASPRSVVATVAAWSGSQAPVPRPPFHGFGEDRDRIVAARVAAAEAGLSDRVTFERAPADRLPGTRYDLVCTFGALEELGAPTAFAARLDEALAPWGAWLLIERAGADRT